MASLTEEQIRMVRRNKLLGMWAAELLGLKAEIAEAYSRELALLTLDFQRSDVLTKLRDDFEAAGLVKTDQEIRRVMDECWLRASGRRQPRQGDASDAAVVQIARNLTSR